MALGQLGKERAEPVVEAYPEPVGAARLLRLGFTSGFLPLAILGFATVEHPDIAVVQQTVAGFGAHAVSLKEHRQPCLLVPDALIALQIDMADGGRRVVDVFGSGTTGQQDGAQKNTGETHVSFLIEKVRAISGPGRRTSVPCRRHTGC